MPSFDQDITDVDAASKLFRLIEALEDLDDVQNVFTNVNLPDDVAAALNDED